MRCLNVYTSEIDDDGDGDMVLRKQIMFICTCIAKLVPRQHRPPVHLRYAWYASF